MPRNLSSGFDKSPRKTQPVAPIPNDNHGRAHPIARSKHSGVRLHRSHDPMRLCIVGELYT